MLNKKNISANSYNGYSYGYGHSYTSRVPVSYWTRPRWFILVVFLLVFWVAAYLLLHFPGNTGYKYTEFSAVQVQQITNILSKKEQGVSTDETIKAPDPALNAIAAHGDLASTKVICDSCGIGRAMAFIRGEYGDKIEERQLSSIREYMKVSSPYETGMFLATKKIKIKNYFWLTGTPVYMELIFWTITAVLCSILFSIGADIKDDPGSRYSKYYSSVIPYDVAKIFYAPFFSVVALLCYIFIKHRNIADVGTNEGIVVFAFATGLFSGRIMGVIVKIKDTIVPGRKTVYKPYQGLASGAYQKAALSSHENTRYELKPSNRDKRRSSKKQTTQQLPLVDTLQAIETETIANAADIENVSVELKLDNRGLFEDEKVQIINSGFRDAVVTIHNVNGKEIMPLMRTATASFFDIKNVVPGIYILRATLTQRLNDEYVMNLFGEKTVFITHENNKLELYIKKYEALG